VPPSSSAVPTEISLATPDGETVPVTALAETAFVVVQLVRYFGCLPCQDWLCELDAAAPDLAASGVGVAAVGGSADYQARWLRDERRMTMPLYLDPDHTFRTAVSADERLGLRLLDPRGAAAYTRSMRRGYRPQKITRDTVLAPAVVILDQAMKVRWRHVGERIGDYPPLREVERAAVGLAERSGVNPAGRDQRDEARS
jgi:peroxiredoxin